ATRAVQRGGDPRRVHRGAPRRVRLDPQRPHGRLRGALRVGRHGARRPAELRGHAGAAGGAVAAGRPRLRVLAHPRSGRPPRRDGGAHRRGRGRGRAAGRARGRRDLAVRRREPLRQPPGRGAGGRRGGHGGARAAGRGRAAAAARGAAHVARPHAVARLPVGNGGAALRGARRRGPRL
ncbi:MAG: Dihydrofolate reductase, partial [uncultured Gemmatimonadaceae bacterium]